MREQLLEEVAAVDATLTVLRGGNSAADLVNAMLDAVRGRALPAQRGSGVGADKLEAVREYVQLHGRVRQSDIARELELNSGTVSTALHALQLEGVVEPGRKENRSRIWEARTNGK